MENENTTHVLPMVSRRHDGTISGILEHYWRSLRGTDAAPRRDLVDPSKLDTALPYSFVAEIVAPGLCRFRVAGQTIRSFVKMEPRGLPLTSLFAASARDDLMQHVRRCADDPAVITLPIHYKQGAFQGRTTGKLILLPLGDGNGSVTRILGGFDIAPSQGLKPVSFELGDQSAYRIETITADESERPTQWPALRLVVNNA